MSTGVSFRGESGQAVKLTTHLHLAPRSRMVELYLYTPICLHGVMLKFRTGKLYASALIKFNFYIEILNEDVYNVFI
jgi:hypothetical protein